VSCIAVHRESLGNVDSHRLDVTAELQLEQIAVAFGGPHGQIRHVASPQLEPQVIASVDHGGRLDDLEVVGVQAVSQPQQCRQAPDKRSVVVIEGHVVGMAVGRQGLAVIAGDIGDQVAFSGGEPVQVGVADQVQRVLVVGRLGTA